MAVPIWQIDDDKDDPKYEQYYVCAVSVVEIFAFDPQDGFILEDLEESKRDPEHKHIEIHYHNCPVKEWFYQPSSGESEDDADGAGAEQNTENCSESNSQD